ncbi:tetratricopeptide repeat protein [uncultured Cardiobacterium sp.]|uniref:tetratricopeptide repeat protein n=1 Tax=uncultured Cardiobacterium sp. TaxID=417619 RepID=UPI0026184EEE|nr:tetratricopeptide repeat protein [uncultured Cardiobacterium sp.]
MKKLWLLLLSAPLWAQNEPPVALLPVQGDTLTPEAALARSRQGDGGLPQLSARAHPPGQEKKAEALTAPADDLPADIPVVVLKDESKNPPPPAEETPPAAEAAAEQPAGAKKDGKKGKNKKTAKKKPAAAGEKAETPPAAADNPDADGKTPPPAAGGGAPPPAASGEKTAAADKPAAEEKKEEPPAAAAPPSAPPPDEKTLAEAAENDANPQTPAVPAVGEVQPLVPATPPPTAAEEEADPPWAGYAQAQSMAENGNPRGALRQLESRLATNPQDSRAAYLKGLVLMQLGRGEEAERWYKMMQANFPDLPQPGNALAVIYAGRGDLPAAELALRDVLLKHPEHNSARVNLARLYVQMAQAEYEKALKATPDNAMIARKLEALKAMQ